MERVALITGGAGYLGVHLAKALKKLDYETICFDQKETENADFDDKFVGDIRDYSALKKIFIKHKIDVIFHLAARIEVGESWKEPELFWSINTGGTCILLNLMKKYKVKDIIYSSTASVYSYDFTTLGEKSRISQNNPYSNSKYAAECAIHDANVNQITFRFFNLCGADPNGQIGESHDPETHLIPLMFQNKNNFVINGKDYRTPDGTCIRDYVHVSDIADAHVMADRYMQKKYLNEPTIFNLGTGKGHSVLDIINAAKKELNLDINYSFGERRRGDADKLVANIDLAKFHLKWKPKHNLASVLKTAYNWHIKNGN